MVVEIVGVVMHFDFVLRDELLDNNVARGGRRKEQALCLCIYMISTISVGIVAFVGLLDHIQGLVARERRRHGCILCCSDRCKYRSRGSSSCS